MRIYVPPIKEHVEAMASPPDLCDGSAGEHTFVISAQGPVLGAYDGTELEEGPDGAIMPINRTIGA